jgi:DNA-binding MarR family transcriptional regulator
MVQARERSMVAESRGLTAWRLFLQAHKELTDVLAAELEAARDLPLSWYDVLIQLSHEPRGRMRMQDLARRILLSKSGLTRLFDRMQEAGLVERQSCPEDRRGTHAALTPAGRRTLQRAMPVHRRGIGQHFSSHLTEAETAALSSAFEKMLAALSEPT